jgi:hypothetical protein
VTRVVCIAATRAEIMAECVEQGLSVSAIETLQSGGTRVVLVSSLDAEALSACYDGRLLTEPVRRTAVRFRHPEA